MSTEAKFYSLLVEAAKALDEGDSEAMRAVYEMLDNLEPEHLTQAQNDRCDGMMVRLSDSWIDAA